MVNNCKYMYLKTLTHTITLLTSIFFLFILYFYIEVDVHEVAHVAPSNLVRSRKETEDDNLGNLTTGPRDKWTTNQLDRGSTGLQDKWTIRKMDRLTSGPRDKWTTTGPH